MVESAALSHICSRDALCRQRDASKSFKDNKKRTAAAMKSCQALKVSKISGRTYLGARSQDLQLVEQEETLQLSREVGFEAQEVWEQTWTVSTTVCS